MLFVPAEWFNKGAQIWVDLRRVSSWLLGTVKIYRTVARLWKIWTRDWL